jgi:hypothetical protein
MQRWTFILAAVLLVALIPFVQAQEEQGKEEKAPAEAKPAEGARLLERFDLNKDGRVTWEEFQKVRSGFAFLDADGDGVLTAKDAEKLKQRHAAKRAERLKERAARGRRFRRPGSDFRGHRGAQPRFRGPARQDGPRAFRDRGPRGRGWDQPGRGPERGWDRPGRGPGRGWGRRGRGPGRGWGRPNDERPPRPPPPPDRGGPY